MVCACPLRRRWFFLSKEDYCTLAKKRNYIRKKRNAALSELAFEPIHILSEPMYIRFICDADGAREVAHRAVSVAWVPHPELVPGGARLSGEVGYGAPRRNAATHLKKGRHVLCQQADETFFQMSEFYLKRFQRVY